MKKLVALSLSASMMLAAAVPAMAFWHMPTTTIVNSSTVFGNDVTSSANTGYNAQTASVITTGAGHWWSPSNVTGAAEQQLITGVALSASGSTIGINQTDCDCLSIGGGTITNFASVIGNDVDSSANSGFNVQTASVLTVGTGTVAGGALQGMMTGGAQSEAWQIVGINQ